MSAPSSPSSAQPGEKRLRPGSEGDEQNEVDIGKMLVSIQSSMQSLLVRFDDQEAKLESISKKVDNQGARLDNIRSELDILRTDFHAQSQKSSREIEKQGETLNQTKNQLSTLSNEFDRLRKERKQDQMETIDLKARMMRDNLLFHGIPQSQGENNTESEKKLRDFLKDTLKMPNADDISFERVHRLGKLPPGTNIGRMANRSVPIIAKFSRHKDREEVRSKRYELKTPYGISEDLPKPIRDARKSVQGLVRELRNQGKRVGIVYPCKVISNGEIVKTVDVTDFCAE